VREEVRQGLAPVEVDLVGAIRGGALHFLDIGASRAYCGDPRAASRDEGARAVESLAQMIVTSVRETWPLLFP